MCQAVTGVLLVHDISGLFAKVLSKYHIADILIVTWHVYCVDTFYNTNSINININRFWNILV